MNVSNPSREIDGIIEDFLASWQSASVSVLDVTAGLAKRSAQSNDYEAIHLSPEHIDRARLWLKSSAGADLVETCSRRLDALPLADERWLDRIVPTQTPQAWSWSRCPVCEFALVHGSYDWRAAEPDRMTCRGCGTRFPHRDFPESIVLQSRWDPRQVFTFLGSKAWTVGSFTVRTSFSGYLRARSADATAKVCYECALLYVLTGEERWAINARRLLLRAARAYSQYLVHTSYGEFADMAPEEAAMVIESLPEPELTPPPNRPDHALERGFWAAGRATSGGQEGHWIARLAGAYDLLRGAKIGGVPLLNESNCRLIEESILKGCVALLIGDERIHNKAGANLGAACLVGAILGSDLLVGRALYGFLRAIREWFLWDGSTPESTGYATMMLHGLWRIPEVLARYRTGSRLIPESLDLYAWSPYARVLRRSAEATHSGGQFLLIDDNRRPCTHSPLIAALATHTLPASALNVDGDFPRRCIAFPDRGRIAQYWYGGYHALLPLFFATNVREKVEAPLTLGRRQNVWPAPNALFERRSDGNGNDEYLYIGTPPDRGHRHRDHLNLVWGWGDVEYLSDLGYLWDMVGAKEYTVRTAAHNVVVVDEMDQRLKGRMGSILLAGEADGLSVVRLRSNAYEECSVYERCIVRIGPPGEGYLIDLFWVRGGSVHDWVMHAPTAQKAHLEGWNGSGYNQTVPYSLENPMKVGGSSGTIAFPTQGGEFLNVTFPRVSAEDVWLAEGWGQRGARDVGITIPYLLRRRKPTIDVLNTFITVYAVRPRVEDLAVVTQTFEDGAAIVEIPTPQGDHLVHCAPPDRLGLLECGSDVTPRPFRLATETLYESRVFSGLFNYVNVRNQTVERLLSLGGDLSSDEHIDRGTTQAGPHGLMIAIAEVRRSAHATILRCQDLDGMDAHLRSEDSPLLYCLVDGSVRPYPVLKACRATDGCWEITVQDGGDGYPIPGACRYGYLLCRRENFAP